MFVEIFNLDQSKMSKKIFFFILLFTMIIALPSCEKLLPPEPKSADVLVGTIPGLTPQQEREHLIGDAAFGKIFGKADGLGPIFVQQSCSNCHVGNGKGHPSTAFFRYASVTGSTVDYLLSKGGPQLQEHSIDSYPIETYPAEANVFTKRVAPAVMGLGYIAALSDLAILANADSIDADADGISGRPNYNSPTPFFNAEAIHYPLNGKYIGRFGKKAEKVTITDQVVFALKQDIGITSPYDETDLYNYQAGINTGDDVPDPEVSANFANSLVFYMRTLKAPERRNTDDPDVIAGESLFNQIGCTSCHKTTFTTSVSDIDALSNKTFHPYSDFLLHDMGSDLDDGYPEGDSYSYEWRTAPLWGVGLAKDSQGGQLFLLHDGRATSFEMAISFHGGEAGSRKDAFNALTEAEKQQLIKFLGSL